MKKNVPILLYLTFVISLITFSCKKKENKTEEDPSSTTSTGSTTSGGTTTGGTTTGGTTTGGTTTGSTPAFTKVRVTGFRVTEITDIEPPLGFDANDGPDVFYIVYKDENDDKIAINGIDDIRNNVKQTNLPLIFNFPSPYVINNLDNYFHLSVYDSDGNTSDFIGGLSFRFTGSSFENYPTTVEKSFYKCKVRINIEWFN